MTRILLALPFLLSAGLAHAEDYACIMEPWQTLKLAAPVQGVVGSVLVDRGDTVHKGQLVATLDSDVEAADLLIAQVHAANDAPVQQAQARLDFLRRKAGRAEELRKTAAASVADADETASDARVAEAQLREAQLNVAQARVEARRSEGLLKQRQITSPVDGIVTERALGPGEFRNDQAHIVTVAQMDPLRIETYLPIALYGHVKPGDTATVLPEAPVGGSYPAKVVVVDQVFDAASGTVGVRLELANPGYKLPGGVHCRLQLAAGS